MARLCITKTFGGAVSAAGFNVYDDTRAPDVSGVPADVRQIIDQWRGEAVVAGYHLRTESWIFIAIHDLTLGPAAGGTRIKVYPTAADGLRDAMHLSEAMTSKWAIINSDWGGGKGVLALSRTLEANERCDLLESYAGMVNALAGSFVTAGDLGTSPADLLYLSAKSEYVTAGDQSHGESVDSGMYTALGLRAAMRACLKQICGDESFRNRSVLVQGLGQVGGMLARLLVLDGARVLINDLDEQRANELKTNDCEVVATGSVYKTACDIYAPCGTGGTLNDDTVAELLCGAICGGANNQLTSPRIAAQLHQRAILYAPDYVVNAGGAIGLTMFSQGAAELAIYQRIESIEERLGNIFQRAAQLSCAPADVADRLVRDTLSDVRARRPPHQLPLI